MEEKNYGRLLRTFSLGLAGWCGLLLLFRSGISERIYHLNASANSPNNGSWPDGVRCGRSKSTSGQSSNHHVYRHPLDLGGGVASSFCYRCEALSKYPDFGRMERTKKEMNTRQDLPALLGVRQRVPRQVSRRSGC